ncbi:MAG TPA: 50S ribosomal protein L18 [Bryobacterales bacterium]|nr:50S ribosomal protein L18 [Bryobacterales bacterium]
MYSRKLRAQTRPRLHERIRKGLRGNAKRPRLAVFRSLQHIYAQVIDDDSGRTLLSAGTNEKDSSVKNGGNIAAAAQTGKLVAERAKKAGIEQVVFDRGGHRYHGRVKALAEAAREAGLKF